jgi:hypothetical protein
MEVVPLDIDAKKAEPGAAQGFRIPRMTPYLVVAQLPGKTTSVTPDAGGAAVVGKKGAAGLPAPPPGGGLIPGAPVAAGLHGPGSADAGSTADAGTPAATAGTGSDTSFVAQTETFVMKIVYLPDYSHAVAVRVKSGLFGASSLQLSFQNGMLTAVGGKVDNTKAGDVAVAALQAITSIATGGASKAGAAPGAAPSAGQKAVSKPDGPPLHPGIYAFVPVSSGSPLGVCTVAYFTPDGAQSPADTDPNRCATPAAAAAAAGSVGHVGK